MKIRAGLAILLSALALAPLAAQAQSKPVNIRVVLAPITNYTPLLVGRDKGWFAAEGLNVTWSIVPGSGGVAVEAVYGGSAEIGGSSVLEPMVARGNGLDIMFAVPGTKIHSKPPDNSALVVRAKDKIQRAADLSGKTVSAGLVNSVNHIHMLEWLQRNKVDAKGIKYVEIPFPQMPDALLQNRLDAVWAVEPFLTVLLKSGNARILAHPYLENLPGMDITAYVAKETWLKANADTARRFKKVVDRATEELLKMPKQERDGWVAKFTGVKPELVADMSLPIFTRQFNVPSLQANIDLAVRHKVVKPFKVETMIWNP